MRELKKKAEIKTELQKANAKILDLEKLAKVFKIILQYDFKNSL